MALRNQRYQVVRLNQKGFSILFPLILLLLSGIVLQSHLISQFQIIRLLDSQKKVLQTRKEADEIIFLGLQQLKIGNQVLGNTSHQIEIKKTLKPMIIWSELFNRSSRQNSQLTEGQKVEENIFIPKKVSSTFLTFSSSIPISIGLLEGGNIQKLRIEGMIGIFTQEDLIIGQLELAPRSALQIYSEEGKIMIHSFQGDMNQFFCESKQCTVTGQQTNSVSQRIFSFPILSEIKVISESFGRSY